MYGLRDRIADWFAGLSDKLQLPPGGGRQILITIGIALILMAIVVSGATCGIRRAITTQGEDLDAGLAGIAGQTAQAIDDIAARVDDVEDNVAGNVTELWQRITASESWLEVHEGALDAITRVRVIGAFPNYRLYLKAGDSGNYTVGVHLLYAPAVGNATNITGAVEAFYAGIDWALPGVPGYLCTPAYNGAVWGVAEVRFNLPLALEENVELAVDARCIGLNATWAPVYMYVDVFKVG